MSSESAAKVVPIDPEGDAEAWLLAEYERGYAEGREAAAQKRLSVTNRVRLWCKRWLLWHFPCPIHGVDHTWKALDPDSSWDAGLITVCSACNNRWTAEIERPA